MNKRQIKIVLPSENTFFIIFLLILKALYIYTIATQLPESYSYWGWSYYKNVQLSNISIEIAVYSFFIITFSHYIRQSDTLSVLYLLFFVCFIIPFNSGLVLSNNNIAYYLFTNIYLYIILVILGRTMRSSPLLSNMKDYSETGPIDIVNKFYNSKRFVWGVRILLLIICPLVIAYAYYTNGFNLVNLFSEIYDTRLEFTDYINEVQGTLPAYIYLLVSKTALWMLPLFFYISLSKGNIFDTIITVVSIVAIYSIEKIKATLFILLVVFAIVYLEKKKKLYYASKFFLFGFVVLFATSIVSYSIRGESLVFSVFIRRIIYVPSYLTNVYYDFFCDNSKLWFRQDAFLIQNLISVFFDRPYSAGAVKVIAERVFSGYVPSPNTGIIAEAFAQMGYLGIIVFPIIDIAFIRIINKTSKFYGRGATYVIYTRLILTLLGNFVLTSSTLIGIIIFVLATKVLKNRVQIE